MCCSSSCQSADSGGNRGIHKRIAKRSISSLATFEHPRQYGDGVVHKVVDDDSLLACIKTVKSAGVLGHSSLPRNGHGQEKRVETGVVETFAQIPAGGEHQTRRSRGGRVLQNIPGGTTFLLAHAPVQDDQAFHLVLQVHLKPFQMLSPFGQQNRASAFAQRRQRLLGDQRVAGFVLGDLPENVLDRGLDRRVFRGGLRR